MGKSLIVHGFKWLEYAIGVFLGASLAFAIAQGLNIISPGIYDYSSEQDLARALKKAYDSGEITHAESRQILRIHRNSQVRFKLEIWRIRLLYVVSICISAVVTVLLFKKYRLLRFRERFGDYFFPDAQR